MIKRYFKAITEKYMYNEGIDIFSKRNLKDISQKEELNGIISLLGKVKNGYKFEDVEIFINKKYEYRTTYTCSCSYNGICSHVIALILSYTETPNKNEDITYQKYEYKILNNKLNTDYESDISNWILGYTEYNENLKILLEEISYYERLLIYTLAIKKNYKLEPKIINILKKLYIENKKFEIKKAIYQVNIKKEKISIKDISPKKSDFYYIKNEELLSENNKKVYPSFLFEKLNKYMEESKIKLGDEIKEYILYKKDLKYILKFKKVNSSYIIIPIIRVENKEYENQDILNINKNYTKVDKYVWEQIDIKEYNEFIKFLNGEMIEFKDYKFYCKDGFFKKEYKKINKNWSKKGISNIKIKPSINYSFDKKNRHLNINYQLKKSKLNKEEVEEIKKTGVISKNGKMYLIKNQDSVESTNVKTNDKEEIFCKLKELEKRNIYKKDLFKDIKIKNLKLNKILRPYQKKGVKWMKFLKKYNFSGILADDMGLGKTLQVLTLISEIHNKSLSLIIVPKSLIYNWEDEIKKFLKTNDYIIYDGKPSDRKKLQDKIKDNGIIITSYGMVRQDIKYLKKLDLEYVILDEAQIIKNNETIIWEAVSNLKSKYRLALTGTPLENHYKDVWSIFEFLMPGYLGHYSKFENQEIEYLKYKIAPFIMRRTKKEVLKELPEKNEKIIRLDLLPKQKIVYDEILTKMRKKVNLAIKNKSNAYFTILGALTYLREVCDHPKLIKKNINESIKVEIFEELILDAIENDHKILVFSQFVKMLDILEKVAFKNNIKYKKLTGKTKNRFKMVEEFNKREDIKIFFISLKAGGTGLNLTSADTIFHIDPWWNPMVESQATDRAHRIGQTQKVNVYKFITRNTIEEKILDIQNRKQEIFNNLIEGNKKEANKISLDELVKLFN